jgi:hypothetical protein
MKDNEPTVFEHSDLVSQHPNRFSDTQPPPKDRQSTDSSDGDELDPDERLNIEQIMSPVFAIF